jgi:hypothetical protein
MVNYKNSKDLLNIYRQENIFKSFARVGFIINVDKHWIFIGVYNDIKKIVYYDSMIGNNDSRSMQYLNVTQ